jgi:hypothetical protein
MEPTRSTSIDGSAAQIQRRTVEMWTFNSAASSFGASQRVLVMASAFAVIYQPVHITAIEPNTLRPWEPHASQMTGSVEFIDGPLWNTGNDGELSCCQQSLFRSRISCSLRHVIAPIPRQ